MKPVTIPRFHKDRPPESQLAEWAATIMDRGYLVIPAALPREACDHFRDRIKDLPAHPHHGARSLVRLFEHGMDFVHLLENEPVFSLAERLFGPRMHIIAIQGHRMTRGTEITTFHSDEIYVPRPEGVSDDYELPPILNVINCHYYLTDVPLELGPTEVVPYSHRAGRNPRPSDGNPPTFRGHKHVSLVCKAGDCIIYNNQMWHRGGPNSTDQTRLSVVPSYAHRFIAQRFWPFLNYNLSREILDECTPRQRELLGEHPRAAYG